MPSKGMVTLRIIDKDFCCCGVADFDKLAIKFNIFSAPYVYGVP